MTEDIHIRLDQPTSLRKAFLETALGASEFLQTIEHIQQLEHERLELKHQFSKALWDIANKTELLQRGIPPLPLEFIQKQQQMLQRTTQHPLRVLTPRQEMAGRFRPLEVPSERSTSSLEDQINELKRKIQSLSV